MLKATDTGSLTWGGVDGAAGSRPAPDRLWCGDITYAATREGWLSLVVLLDAHSRRVVGWAMVDHLRTGVALDALAMALARRRPDGHLRVGRGLVKPPAPLRAQLSSPATFAVDVVLLSSPAA